MTVYTKLHFQSDLEGVETDGGHCVCNAKRILVVSMYCMRKCIIKRLHTFKHSYAIKKVCVLLLSQDTLNPWAIMLSHVLANVVQ